MYMSTDTGTYTEEGMDFAGLVLCRWYVLMVVPQRSLIDVPGLV